MSERDAKIAGLLEAAQIAEDAQRRFGDLPGVGARHVASRIRERVKELEASR